MALARPPFDLERGGAHMTRHGIDCQCSACLRCDDAARIMRGAREAAGLSAEALGAACGRSRAVIRGMEDAADRSERVHFDPLLHPDLAPHVARAIAERCGLVVFELPTGDTFSDDAAAIATMHRETAEATQAALASLVSGVRTKAQNLELQRELRESIAAQARYLRMLEASEREPVVGIDIGEAAGAVSGARDGRHH